MLKPFLAVVFLGAAAPVFGQAIEPGEWEFHSITTSPILPRPQDLTLTQCVKKEDASNPERWMTQQAKKNDCTVTPGKKTADSLTWEISCAKSNMRGTGTAKIRARSVESEMRLTGEMQGRSFDIITKTSGKRLGPCPS
jgi:hypothetical protein